MLVLVVLLPLGVVGSFVSIALDTGLSALALQVVGGDMDSAALILLLERHRRRAPRRGGCRCGVGMGG